MKVYFDNAASTPLDSKVIEVMDHVIKKVHGNPSSTHADGRLARTIIEDARRRIAAHMKASQGEIFFTSCATESNNTAILGAIRDLGIKRIITSPTEHPCVLNTVDFAKTISEVDVSMLSVDQKGCINIDALRSLLQKDARPTLVTIMHGNNEIGTMHDIASIGAICYDHGALFHCDTVQTIGKYPIDVSTQYISFLSGSGHKIFGPKGSGFLYVNTDNVVRPLLHGGGQERQMRSGTENTYGIAGIAMAMDRMVERREMFHDKVTVLTQRFKSNLELMRIDVGYNGDPQHHLSHIINLHIPRTDRAEMIMMNLDIHGICASAGSACNSGAEQDSHVLEAIGLPKARKSLRFSFSHFNTEQEVDYVTDTLAQLL